MRRTWLFLLWGLRPLLVAPDTSASWDTCASFNSRACPQADFVYSNAPGSFQLCYCYGDTTMSCQYCPQGFGRYDCGCALNSDGRSYTCGPGECRDCRTVGGFMMNAQGQGPCVLCGNPALGTSLYVVQPCDGVHDIAVAPCPAGSYCEAGVKFTCYAGAYCPGGGHSPVNCTATEGELCDATGLSAPVQGCALGYVLGGVAGSYTCGACEPGYTSAPPSLACAPCPAGSAWANHLCAPCAPGYYQPNAAATFCAACPAGFYQTLAGATACLPCPPGSHMAHTAAGAGCARCPAGSFEPRANSSVAACALCPLNTYTAGGDGATACAACPAGLMTQAPGAIDVSFCQPCGARRAIVGGVCVVCPPYDVALAATAQYFCPGDGQRYPIQQAPQLGASFVRVASDGLTDNVLGTCSACGAGRYLSRTCTLAQDGACADCRAESLPYYYVVAPCTATADAVIAACTDADRQPGARCNPCPPGTFAITAGACQACPPNTSSAAAGASACAPCAVGFASDGGASFCTRVCPDGSFAPDGLGACVVATDQLPWRVLATAAQMEPQSVAQLAADGSLFVTSPGGLLWRLSADDSAWLVADGLGNTAPALVAVGGHTLLAAADGGVWRIDAPPSAEAVVTPLALPGVLRPSAIAALPDAPTQVVLADWDAHCVWALDVARAGSLAAIAGSVGVRAADMRVGATTSLLLYPSLVAALSASLVLVGDARALWGTASAGLSYYCGGGARLPLDALACADLDFAGSQFRSLAAAYAGANEPAAFLLSPLYGVWMLVLLPNAPMTLRPLRAVGGGEAALAGMGTQLLLVANRQLLLAGLGAFTRLAPTPVMHCACDAGLYCNTTRQQCVPAPAGTVAPAWTNAPRPCPPGTLAQANACVACPLPQAFTTYTAGALQCVPRCGNGQLYHEGACVAGCNASRGEYQVSS